MADFISTFITGFSSVVEQNLPVLLPTVKIKNIYDGLIHYSYNGDSRDIEKVIYFNNTFFLLNSGKYNNFQALVNQTVSQKKYFLISKGSCRVRFNDKNQFTKVDKGLIKKAEDYIAANSKLKIDRVNPETELWFILRSEGTGFAGQLISKREFTEKNLNKGELRPEFAYLMCAFADIKKEYTVCEPFCGYGSVPVQLSKKFRFEKLFVSDIDQEKINMVSQKKQLKDNERICVSCDNAFELKKIADKSVDLVITDPPWGFFEDVGDISEFYKKMFDSFRRILKEEGRMVILSARKEELEKTAGENHIEILQSLNTLVNGKKASLYKLAFN
ncbi:MAG: methyltransferase [Treponema sp.]|nr:methyltransferase [Treponema sp.]